MSSTASSDSSINVLIYILRRDLRLEDNPVLHTLASNPAHLYPHTHLLPIYIFPAQQVEISGFNPGGLNAGPDAVARSKTGKFWRCGEHRVKFLAESVWALKESLQSVGSNLEIRVGTLAHVLSHMVDGFNKNLEGGRKCQVTSVWMTKEEGPEEMQEESECMKVCETAGIDFRLWKDKKYLIDDDDIEKLYTSAASLPDVFTAFRKDVEPLREIAREVLPTPAPDKLPPLPPCSVIPRQQGPHIVPDNEAGVIESLLLPLKHTPSLRHPPQKPKNTTSAHPFGGGSKRAHDRMRHLLQSGSMTRYAATRNGLLGEDFSTKLSAWLALGCITARQIHDYMFRFEEGTLGDEYASAPEYGMGETAGTKGVRFELAWRDYMRLCTKKFPDRLLSIGGYKNPAVLYPWKRPDMTNPENDPESWEKLQRFLEGRTGMGLIDASQRELYLTGYTSNRARQNVASYLAKHIDIDWRLGAEWYECWLIDYDVSSNWGNWQYVAGVGNDPRGDSGRIFNSVKQAFDYDPNGEYIYHWMPEFQQDKYGIPTRLIHKLEDKITLEADKVPLRNGMTPVGQPVVIEAADIFRAYNMPRLLLERLGWDSIEWVRDPLKRIDYTGKQPGKWTPRGEKGGKGKKNRKPAPKSCKDANGGTEMRVGEGGDDGEGPGSSQGPSPEGVSSLRTSTRNSTSLHDNIEDSAKQVSGNRYQRYNGAHSGGLKFNNNQKPTMGKYQDESNTRYRDPNSRRGKPGPQGRWSSGVGSYRGTHNMAHQGLVNNHDGRAHSTRPTTTTATKNCANTQGINHLPPGLSKQRYTMSIYSPGTSPTQPGLHPSTQGQVRVRLPPVLPHRPQQWSSGLFQDSASMQGQPETFDYHGPMATQPIWHHGPQMAPPWAGQMSPSMGPSSTQWQPHPDPNFYHYGNGAVQATLSGTISYAHFMESMGHMQMGFDGLSISQHSGCHSHWQNEPRSNRHGSYVSRLSTSVGMGNSGAEQMSDSFYDSEAWRRQSPPGASETSHAVAAGEMDGGLRGCPSYNGCPSEAVSNIDGPTEGMYQAQSAGSLGGNDASERPMSRDKPSEQERYSVSEAEMARGHNVVLSSY